MPSKSMVQNSTDNILHLLVYSLRVFYHQCFSIHRVVGVFIVFFKNKVSFSKIILSPHPKRSDSIYCWCSYHSRSYRRPAWQRTVPPRTGCRCENRPLRSGSPPETGWVEGVEWEVEWVVEA